MNGVLVACLESLVKTSFEGEHACDLGISKKEDSYF